MGHLRFGRLDYLPYVYYVYGYLKWYMRGDFSVMMGMCFGACVEVLCRLIWLGLCGM